MKTFRNNQIKFMIFSRKTAFLQSFHIWDIYRLVSKNSKVVCKLELWKNNFVRKTVI